MKARRFTTSFLLAAALCATSFGAEARDPAEAKRAPSLLGEHGVPAAERLLQSDLVSERLRAFARLSALGTPRALELLAKALEPGGAARGAEEHLTAVRALAPHARSPLAREALVRVLSSPPVDADAGPLSNWVRASAALALAQTQDPAALSALGRALRKQGHAAELAMDALVANPPRELTPILRLPGAASKELCQALGALGDRRAEDFLRDTVRRGAPDARAAAALALLRLGSTEVVELSRHWLRSERQPVLLAAAAQILTQTGSEDATRALSRLAGTESTRELALSLLLTTGGRVAAPPELRPELSPERAGALLELFARGGSWGQARWERALSSPETQGLALYALSRVPGAAPRARLERALSEPRLRTRALRALALRQARLGDESDELASLSQRWLESTQPAERAAAAFAAGVLSPERLPRLLGSRDRVTVLASASLALQGEAARAAAERLTRERDPVLRAALSIALLDASAAEVVPTSLLLELTHAAGPGSLLAASALAARKDAELLPLVRELLGSGDPWLRAHILLGLGEARDSDALGMIEQAYRFEPDAGVRHAAVVAMSRRPEPVRQRLLRLAAELDAAASVRSAARLALGGQRLAGVALGVDTLWLELAENPGLAPGLSGAALVRFGSGPALPVVADPEGVVALAGVDPAPVSLRLALLGDRVNVAEARP